MIAASDAPRPAVVTLLALLQFGGAFFWFATAAGIVFAGSAAPSFAGIDTHMASLAVAGLLACLGILQVACGVGLWTLSDYGRTLQLVFAWVGMLAFPVGTIIAILIVVYLGKPGIKVLFSEKSPAEFTEAEREAVAAVRHGAVRHVAIFVLLGILAIAGLGIAGTFAIPGLLHARMSANEAAVLGALRTIHLEQAEYFDKCGGYAPSLDALRRSIPAATRLADTYDATRGYRVAIDPGASSVPLARARPGCQGAVTEYLAHAEPLERGTTGSRFFGMDATGAIMQSTVEPVRDLHAVTAFPVQ